MHNSTNYDQIAGAYEAWHDTPLWNYAEPHTLFSLLGDLRGRSGLDIACGAGSYTRLLREAGADTVVGVDVSSEQIRLARRAEHQQPRGIRYDMGDAEALDIGQFDVVIAGHLFGYAGDRAALARMCVSLARSTRPGGRFATLYRAYDASPRDKQPLLEPYQLRVVMGPDLDHGSRADIELLLKGGPVKLSNMLWKHALVKTALERVGFIEVQFHPMRISRRGIQALGIDYWQDYLAYPGTTVVTATRGA